VSQGNRPSYTYTASDWNPITHAEALTNSLSAYRGSKTFAERAAWDFMEREKPRFALTTLNPPFVFGPVVPYAGLSLEDVNASNRFFVDFLKGKATETIYYAWIHVEDCAAAHVKAIEAGAAEMGNERVFLTSAEQFCHRDILEIMHEEVPELRARLPDRQDWDGLGYPEGGVYKVDATRARELIGKEFITLRQCVVETVDMIREVL
jgi:nucleoside-diphosphate-sugar epimerase